MGIHHQPGFHQPCKSIWLKSLDRRICGSHSAATAVATTGARPLAPTVGLICCASHDSGTPWYVLERLSDTTALKKTIPEVKGR